jgi:hypothetical protein
MRELLQSAKEPLDFTKLTTNFSSCCINQLREIKTLQRVKKWVSQNSLTLLESNKQIESLDFLKKCITIHFEIQEHYPLFRRELLKFLNKLNVVGRIGKNCQQEGLPFAMNLSIAISNFSNSSLEWFFMNSMIKYNLFHIWAWIFIFQLFTEGNERTQISRNYSHKISSWYSNEHNNSQFPPKITWHLQRSGTFHFFANFVWMLNEQLIWWMF